MFSSKQLASNTLTSRRLLIFLCTLLMSACASQGSLPLKSRPSVDGVAIIGGAAKIGLKAPVDKARMSSDLKALLVGRGAVTVTPTSSVRQIVGAGPHDEMMAFYARHGHFAPYQVQRLMAADLSASQALAVRLESDLVERLPIQRRRIFNTAGEALAGREQRIFVTRRTTQLSATLLDLRNGRVIWTRQYRVAPETVLSSNHQIGESFTTSVAAAVANTLVHGMKDASHPAPSPVGDSLLALLEEVAYNAPVK